MDDYFYNETNVVNLPILISTKCILGWICFQKPVIFDRLICDKKLQCFKLEFGSKTNFIKSGNASFDGIMSLEKLKGKIYSPFRKVDTI